MESANLQIYWHESQPIYSLCFQPVFSRNKLITAGGDNKIRIWNLNLNDTHSKVDSIDLLSALTHHEQAVNVVRPNSLGNVLASAGDDGQLLLWKMVDTDEPVQDQFGANTEDDDEPAFKESWFVWKRLRSKNASSSEIYDIAWSPDNNFLVTASMDNTLRIFDTNSTKQIIATDDHSHYVQGVVWDPQNKYIFSQSADRSLCVYEIIFDPTNKSQITNLRLKNRILRSDLPQYDADTKLNYSLSKTTYLFHNETLPSFFRRLAISPCGNLLAVPAGIFRSNPPTSSAPGLATANTAAATATTPTNQNNEFNNAVYLYTRGSIKANINKPVLRIPFLNKPAIVVSFNPNLYELSSDKESYLKLPYKLIFAIATSNEVLIYDSESIEPISVIGNLHYTPLTDLAWSQDGSLLMMSSTDGFVSYVSVIESVFGPRLSEEKSKKYLEFAEKDTPTENTPVKPIQAFSTKQPVIVNILSVKRKSKDSLVSKSKKPNMKPFEPQSEKNSPSKEKKRIQPILILNDNSTTNGSITIKLKEIPPVKDAKLIDINILDARKCNTTVEDEQNATDIPKEIKTSQPNVATKKEIDITKPINSVEEVNIIVEETFNTTNDEGKSAELPDTVLVDVVQHTPAETTEKVVSLPVEVTEKVVISPINSNESSEDIPIELSEEE